MKYKKKKNYFGKNTEGIICSECGAFNGLGVDLCCECKTPLGFMTSTDPAKQISKIGVVRKRFLKSKADPNWQDKLILHLLGIIIFCIVFSVYLFRQ